MPSLEFGRNPRIPEVTKRAYSYLIFLRSIIFAWRRASTILCAHGVFAAASWRRHQGTNYWWWREQWDRVNAVNENCPATETRLCWAEDQLHYRLSTCTKEVLWIGIYHVSSYSRYNCVPSALAAAERLRTGFGGSGIAINPK